MFTSDRWLDVSIRKYKKYKKKEIDTIVGIDSEAYENGIPFILCTSESEIIKPENFFDFFRTTTTKHYSTFNLKYDSGAFLYFLPDNKKYELWEKTFTQYNDCYIEYLPHKCLKLQYSKKQTVFFWDIMQFYASSLDTAAKTYLNKSKKDIETKKFSIQYVKQNYKKICEYCISDAILTAELSQYLLKKLKEFNIRTTALYSNASLSFTYYADFSPRIVTIYRYYRLYPDLVKYAVDSYQGGKFEITSRGVFNGYEYDIVSAYPYEIMNLIDITVSNVLFSSTYQPDAVYGFLRVHIINNGENHIPCGLMIKNTRIYPAGDFYLTITKNEYEYMITLSGVSIEILSAFWLFVKTKKYPYKKTTEKLFEMKDYYKNTLPDRLLLNVSKYMLNSFYGKTCQAIEDYTGKINCGIGFNPVYASVITANCRIKVCKIQNELKNSCLAVHTDSVITTKSIDEKYLSSSIGNFKLESQGKGLLLACGQYEHAEKNAFKGFSPLQDDTWTKILKRNGNNSTIDYPILHVESWIEAVAKGHYDKINLFTNEIKKINLNADIKRVWLEKTNCLKLISTLQTSQPRIIINSIPESWNQ